jgi:hypothetical protein
LVTWNITNTIAADPSAMLSATFMNMEHCVGISRRGKSISTSVIQLSPHIWRYVFIKFYFLRYIILWFIIINLEHFWVNHPVRTMLMDDVSFLKPKFQYSSG